MNSNIIIFSLVVGSVVSCQSSPARQAKEGTTSMNDSLTHLTAEEEFVIVHKGTERPWSGAYTKHKEVGVYSCKRCNAHLYKSDSKFESGCGWPSFDAEIPGAVKRVPDADGERTEIVCQKCGAHLGHVFLGEGMTVKNTRHCVNSISLKFLDQDKLNAPDHYQSAFFAGGCFWGVEHYFTKTPGVIRAISGYMGGKNPHPTYEQVSSGKSGHFETVEVVYDPKKVSYEELAKLFFEIHDPSQKDGQGPDIGEQYHSVIFVKNEQEKAVIQKLTSYLESKGTSIATQVFLTEPNKPFWPAEDYHQKWYSKKGGEPYCHKRRKKFE